MPCSEDLKTHSCLSKLPASLSALMVCLSKDSFQWDVRGKEPSTGTLKLLNYCFKFSNTSRMYLYWQVDRKAIICTLTNDFNSKGGFLK